MKDDIFRTSREPVAGAEWPSHFANEVESMKTIRTWLEMRREERNLYLSLAVMVLVAVGLLILSNSAQPPLLQEATHDLGIALLSAAILATTIDIWVTTKIVRDVFRAAVGHILPPELRDEVHWISNFKCITHHCECNFDIEDIGSGVVKLTLEYDTELSNITSTTQNVERLFTIDDWGIPLKSAEILEYEYTKGNESPVRFTGAPERRASGELVINLEKISLRPNERVRTFIKAQQYLHENDVFHEEWLYPVRKPEINIRSISESLNYSAGFAHDPPVTVLQLGRRYILQGTLMPHQTLRLRWWPKKVAETKN